MQRRQQQLTTPPIFTMDPDAIKAENVTRVGTRSVRLTSPFPPEKKNT